MIVQLREIDMNAEPTKLFGFIVMMCGFVWLIALNVVIALGILIILIGFYLWHIDNTQV
jgi:type IV secretory pathway VirB3-like protein